MKRIICPDCGEVDVYQILETIRRGLLFDVNDECTGETGEFSTYEGKRKRCLCGRCVKIVEDGKDVEE